MPPVGAVSLISARRPRPPFSATRPKPCQRSGEHDRARVHASLRFGPLRPGLPSHGSMRADVALPQPKACADRSLPGDGSQPSGFGLGRSFLRRERQRRLPGRLRPRRNAMPTPVARLLPSSPRGARDLSRAGRAPRGRRWPGHPRVRHGLGDGRGTGRRAPKTAFDEALDGRLARTKRLFAI